MTIGNNYEDKILIYMHANITPAHPVISRSELSDHLGISGSAVSRYLMLLKRKGFIEGIRGGRNPGWILKENLKGEI